MDLLAYLVVKAVELVQTVGSLLIIALLFVGMYFISKRNGR